MNSKAISISKKAASTVLILVLLVLSACSSNGTVAINSMFDLSKSMLEACEFKEMSYASSEDADAKSLLKNVSDIDYSKVDKYFISYATSGSKNADEIVVIALKNQKDTKEALDSLNKHLEYRKSIYATYDTSQSSKLLAAKTFSYKNIACLIVADDASAVEKAFYDYIKAG